jgi:hypothetical protein
LEVVVLEITTAEMGMVVMEATQVSAELDSWQLAAVGVEVLIRQVAQPQMVVRAVVRA